MKKLIPKFLGCLGGEIMIFIFSILLYLVIGSLAGLVGALLGIGGGVITVPALLFVFSFLGFPKDSVMHIAIGTSLCVMVTSTFSATYFHHKKGSVSWTVIRRIFLGIVLGSLAGVFIAENLSSDLLKIIFGCVACLIGFTFRKPIKVRLEKHKVPGFPIFSLIGTGVSCISNILGIGGGLFMVPIFIYYQFDERRAIGTSSATSFLISLAGALSYIFFKEASFEIPGCFGYLYFPAFLTLSLSALISSFYGVRLTHSLSPLTLRKTFSAVMIAAGLLMIFV